MTTELRLDFADIQGNILRGYRSPVARYVFLRFDDPACGRRAVEAITDEITTAVEWDGGMPESTVNLAFTFEGLGALGLNPDTLEGFPADFRQGMLVRARMLGDVGESDPARWEPLWRSNEVHAFVMIGARDPDALARRFAWLEAIRATATGVTIVGTQDAGALVINGAPTNKEHFGFSDGFGNPDIAATGLPPQPGGGKPVANGGWEPVAAGEFLLGHLDEHGEVSKTPPPIGLFRNGTFVAYRKLHQKVATFRRWLADEGSRYPGGVELLAAKVVGRWRDGTPLALSPDKPDPAIVADDNQVINFRYAGDPQGLRCPLGSHIRRANPRDGLGFGTKLTASRRIIRRGLPYGAWTPDGQPGDDDAEHGVIFLALCGSLAEQFEFVLQQWINYGNDAQQGNDSDALVGNRAGADKMVVPGDPAAGGYRPHLCFGLPQFIVTRGGAYFFMPGLRALRWLVQSRDSVEQSLLAFDATGAGDDTAPISTNQDPSMLESVVTRIEKLGAGIVHEIGALPGEVEQFVEKELAAIGAEMQHLSAGLKAWAVAHPERIFAVLRRIKPILTVHDLTLVLRFDDVQEVMSRDGVFQVPYADNFRELTGGGNFFLGMSNTPEYQRDVSNMRIVVRREDLGTRIAPLVASSADRAVAAAHGRIDVVGLAAGVATDFVADYFGTPSPTPDTYFAQGGAISGYLFLAAEELRAPAVVAASGMLATLRATIAARHQARGQRDDVLERCLVLQDAGVPGMDDATLALNLFGLVVGAIPTTTAMVARAVDELLRRPRELALAHQAAANGDSATVTRYVSEAMRFNPLGPGVPRIVLEDYTLAKGTLRATTVKAGTKVLASLQSATFDDHRIDDPNDFRIDRPDYNYMHFGYGLHTCFGQYINMVQIPRIAQAVLSRPNLRRAAGVDGTLQLDGPFPSHLVVEFDPS